MTPDPIYLSKDKSSLEAWAAVEELVRTLAQFSTDIVMVIGMDGEQHMIVDALESRSMNAHSTAMWYGIAKKKLIEKLQGITDDGVPCLTVVNGAPLTLSHLRDDPYYKRTRRNDRWTYGSYVFADTTEARTAVIEQLSKLFDMVKFSQPFEVKSYLKKTYPKNPKENAWHKEMPAEEYLEKGSIDGL